MVTRIFYRNNFRTIRPNKVPRDTKELNAMLLYNKAPLNLVKSADGWYRVARDQSFHFVARTLYLLTFKEWLEVALNDNFVANPH
jgi:hypothetical protein